PSAEEVDLEQLGNSAQEVADTVIQEAQRIYGEREREFGEELVRQVEVQLMLSLIDERWADYLTTLEHLKDDIRWQSLGQRDPLVEFKSEAFAAFQSFQESLKQEIVRYVFHSQIQVQPAPEPLAGVAVHAEAGSAVAGVAQKSEAAGQTPEPVTTPGAAVPAGTPAMISGNGQVRPADASQVPVPASRNSLCPCGSGRKYKRCHGAGT
ncbi:MAG: SEC-C metal-binding domain-containing protein, partial [Candidatus Dormibacteraeota bacterium]|nr:SEC-C metal-binding domain-containing protein [Candidatus Dormibacteraeota bacterium]